MEQHPKISHSSDETSTIHLGSLQVCKVPIPSSKNLYVLSLFPPQWLHSPLVTKVNILRQKLAWYLAVSLSVNPNFSAHTGSSSPKPLSGAAMPSTTVLLGWTLGALPGRAMPTRHRGQKSLLISCPLTWAQALDFSELLFYKVRISAVSYPLPRLGWGPTEASWQESSCISVISLSQTQQLNSPGPPALVSLPSPPSFPTHLIWL